MLDISCSLFILNFGLWKSLKNSAAPVRQIILYEVKSCDLPSISDTALPPRHVQSLFVFSRSECGVAQRNMPRADVSRWHCRFPDLQPGNSLFHAAPKRRRRQPSRYHSISLHCFCILPISAKACPSKTPMPSTSVLVFSACKVENRHRLLRCS